jgi:hypothetical protein
VQITKFGKTVPKWSQTYQISIKYTKIATKIPNYRITPPFSIPSKIHQNWDFWLENIPSGNPGCT